MFLIVDKEQFVRKVQEINEIICIGAGKFFEKTQKIFQDTDVLEKIKYVIDNNSDKWDSTLIIRGRCVKIQKMEVVERKVSGNSIILITCMDYPSILEQIERYKRLGKLDVFCIAHIIGFEADRVALSKAIPEKIKLSDEQEIPKKIHYCWFGRNPIPEKYQHWMQSWSKYCPDYEIIEWNEDNYDITKNTYMCQAYEAEKWAFVPDYARLDIVYQHGGIYLDTDVELVQSLDDLLYQKGFAGFESQEYVAFGLGFGAISGLPVLKDLMKRYEDCSFINEDGSLNLIASPVFQTEVLVEKGLKKNGEYQIVSDMTIYPEKMLCGKSVASRQIKLKEYTRAIHHYDASWKEFSTKSLYERLEKDMQHI